MRVVPVLGLVLDGGGVNGDSAGFLFRGGIDFVVLFGGTVSQGGQGHSESGGESGLAVVDVTDCADVDMGFLALEFATSGSDCEAAVLASGGCEVENGGGVEEGGREMG